MLSCAAARVFASSLLERRTAMGSDGATLLVPRSGRGFPALRVGALSGSGACSGVVSLG